MHRQLMLQICLAVMLGLAAHAAEPLGHWPFDGHVNDVAGSANGTFFGGVPDYANGRIDRAIRFDGADDYVQVMVDNLEAYTITAWVMPDRVEPASIVTRTSPSGTTTHWSHQMRIAVSGEFEHYVWDGAEQRALGTTQVEAGNWYFVAVSATNNGPVRLYVDAREEGTAGAVGTMWTEGDRYDIGSNSGGGFGWFPGIIDDVRIYDEELTEAELATMMTEAPFPYAFGAKPANGAMLGQTSVVLEWRAGDFAVSHNVYVGESFDDVNDGLVEAIPTTATRMNLVAPDGPYPAGLVPGQSYYWRVDEINEAHPDSPWKGDVWSFWIQPAGAWAPSPTDEGQYVLTDQALTWNSGMGTLFHTVYFGESFEEVDNAVTGGWMIADALYDPGVLETAKTYYWRVDEFTMTGTVTGETWSFTTLPEIPVAEDPNLMLWWTLAEGIGSTAVDWSGHGNHGSLRGDPQWIDGALTFDGRDDYVSVVLDVSETEYAAALWF
ncbi:MAG: LamG domain-containing protein, partial [Sedimentisphaerales bacterium]|nr:LamG domain-containing protein [Sedimentisphaerales bacterium]